MFTILILYLINSFVNLLNHIFYSIIVLGDKMKKLIENKDSLFNSILFLLFGIILFTNPGGILKFISYIAGGIFLVIGVFNILSYYRKIKKLNIEENKKLISGIIFIVISFIIVFLSSFIGTTIRLICGGWIIYSGISKLIDAINFKGDKTKFYINLSISILIILCGFYVALTANLVFSLLGLFIIIYAVLDIISYVTKKKIA